MTSAAVARALVYLDVTFGHKLTFRDPRAAAGEAWCSRGAGHSVTAEDVGQPCPLTTTEGVANG